MNADKTARATQDPFLNDLRASGAKVNIFLVNGIKLVGNIESFDPFCVLLKGQTGISQLVYKHAISTISPDLSTDQKKGSISEKNNKNA